MGVAALISMPSGDGKRSGNMLRLARAGKRGPKLQHFHQHEPFLK